MDMDSPRMRTRRHYGHASRWCSEMVGMGTRACPLNAVVGVFNRLSQARFYRHECYVDRNPYPQHAPVAQEQQVDNAG